jgi:hypothetical protein
MSWGNKCSTPLMASLNKSRSSNLLNKSHNKLHGLTLYAIIVFNMIFEWLPHLCTPHITIICKVPQSSSTIQGGFPKPQRPGRFSNASKWRAPVGRWVKIYIYIVYPFEHCEVNDYIWMVCQYTQSPQRYRHPSCLTLLPEREETELNGSDRKQLRIDHCSYSTILT